MEAQNLLVCYALLVQRMRSMKHAVFVGCLGRDDLQHVPLFDAAMEKVNENVSFAAKSIGLTRAQLAYRLRHFRIPR